MKYTNPEYLFAIIINAHTYVTQTSSHDINPKSFLMSILRQFLLQLPTVLISLIVD